MQVVAAGLRAGSCRADSGGTRGEPAHAVVLVARDGAGNIDARDQPVQQVVAELLVLVSQRRILRQGRADAAGNQPGALRAGQCLGIADGVSPVAIAVVAIAGQIAFAVDVGHQQTARVVHHVLDDVVLACCRQ